MKRSIVPVSRRIVTTAVHALIVRQDQFVAAILDLTVKLVKTSFVRVILLVTTEGHVYSPLSLRPLNVHVITLLLARIAQDALLATLVLTANFVN